MTFRVFVALVLGFTAALSTPVVASSLGLFSGRVVAEWLTVSDGPDRDMRLVESFAFVDPAGTRWSVPVGAVVNGASIPRVLWTLAGSPFTGDYRRASVIHDYYCGVKSRPWQEVHYVFYTAMRADGVSERQAKAYYAAVYAGGPRWSRISGAAPGSPQFAVVVPEISEDTYRNLESWIESTNPSIDEIKSRVDDLEQP